MSRALRPLERRNYAGRTVTLAEGVGVAAAAACVEGPLLAVIGGIGLLDDVVEPWLSRRGRMSSAKGLRGHLRALARGELTTGAVKVIALPAAALGLAVREHGARPSLLLPLDAALIAGSANLLNLLDLRPGRALKSTLLLSAPLAATFTGTGERSAPAAGALALLALPVDLAEKGMLGDTGANSLGALLGLAALRRLPLRGRILALGVITGLTLASERISFSRVIDATPALRALDRLGRRDDSR